MGHIYKSYMIEVNRLKSEYWKMKGEAKVESGRAVITFRVGSQRGLALD
jgi:hypothetical protein